MRLYLNLKNGISEIEASETPVEGFTLYDLVPVPEPPAPLPDGVSYFGPAPLKVRPSRDEQQHVFAIRTDWKDDEWEPSSDGSADFPELHYALRRGTEIARANGIPDQP